jgi:hypothetical protein
MEMLSCQVAGGDGRSGLEVEDKAVWHRKTNRPLKYRDKTEWP